MSAPETGQRDLWHCRDAGSVVRSLGSNAEAGLGDAAVLDRQRRHGPNEIEAHRPRTVFAALLAQFKDFMILVLIAAAAISGLLGSIRDSVAILVIVLLNAVVGAVQELRAQKAIQALRRMAAPTARVVRNSETVELPSTRLVPGDLILLEAGDIVPADARLLTATGLRIDESSLTGESVGVDKRVEALGDAGLPLGDRVNMAYKDTRVTRGTARAVVVATGAATEMGRIAALLQGETDSRTPLQKRLARFGRQLSLVILGICALIFTIGLLQGRPPMLMFLTSVSLAVAAVPEALPAVVTISLALGAYKLTRRRTLVRRLPAVEGLGSVTYICADKTGTLTENRMILDRIRAAGATHDAVPGPGTPLGRHLGPALALNNEVRRVDGELTGDPTELALLAAAEAAGHLQSGLASEMPRLAQFPFDEDRKRMSTVHRVNGGSIVYTKGAPELVLPLCDRQWRGEGAEPIDRAALRAEAQALAEDGYRVLAVAMRELGPTADAGDAETIESGMTLLALVGLLDPPRPEAAAAVADCRSAGITPVMITGDHPATALNVATRVGIAAHDSELMTGRTLSALDDEELERRVRDVAVYARVDPEQKIRIVEALTAVGESVAMTGDGVNDAPALRSAAIGVAMGGRGTDVAREAADIVLMDDNFATIVDAVGEGRRILDNIRKFIKYTMTSNSGEIWTLLVAPLLGLPVPLLPIHILWINLVTDGLPGLALAAEPAERGTMRRPPRPPGQSFFSGMWRYMLLVGLLIGGLSIASQYWSISRGAEYWQTVTFTVLVLAQLGNVFAIRSDSDSLFSMGIASNPQLLAAVMLTVVLQLAAIYVPALNALLHTTPLPAADLAVCFGLGASVLVVVEVAKISRRTRSSGG